MALIGVEIADVGKLAAAPFCVGNVGHQQLDHASPFVVSRPGGVAQRDFCGGTNPVAVVEMVVVHLLYREELVGIGRHGAQCLVVEEVVAAALATEPEFHAFARQGQQLVTCLQIALLLRDRHELRDAGQAFALPIHAGAPVVGVLPGRKQVAAPAHVALELVIEVGQARALRDLGPIGYKTRVTAFGLELP